MIGNEIHFMKGATTAVAWFGIKNGPHAHVICVHTSSNYAFLLPFVNITLKLNQIYAHFTYIVTKPKRITTPSFFMRRSFWLIVNMHSEREQEKNHIESTQDVCAVFFSYST